MGRKRNERERIDTGLRYLTEGLAPFVDRHMTARHGPGWLAGGRTERRHSRVMTDVQRPSGPVQGTLG